MTRTLPAHLPFVLSRIASMLALVAVIPVAAAAQNATPAPDATPAPGAAPAGDAAPAQDPDFEALQERGEIGMGVDQYASTHVFDALPDGGRIEYQHDGDEPEGIEQIRRHLKEIRTAFEAGDFSTPAFVHAQEVPGTAVMAARGEYIEYRYSELPRGAELRLVTADPEALAAIREFMAFQRADHRAGGMDHDHGSMDADAMDHGTMHMPGHGAGHGPPAP